MARPPKNPDAPVVPVEPMFEPSEVPIIATGPVGKAKSSDSFRPIIEKVRELKGQSALILQHPKASHIMRTLKTAFPDCEFVCRTIKKEGGKDTTGVWSRLKAKADAPSPNNLTAGT